MKMCWQFLRANQTILISNLVLLVVQVHDGFLQVPKSSSNQVKTFVSFFNISQAVCGSKYIDFNLDPDPEFRPNLVPEPGLCYQF